MSRQEQISLILSELKSNVSDIRGAALVSSDGLTIASDMPADINMARTSAMSAALLGLGKKSTESLMLGDLKGIEIKANNAMYIILSAGNRAVLAIIANADCNLGLIHMETQIAVEKLISLT